LKSIFIFGIFIWNIDLVVTVDKYGLVLKSMHFFIAEVNVQFVSTCICGVSSS